MALTSIIKKPIITEKSLQDASRGVFTFLVDRTATKDQIRSALERFYDVDVINVRSILAKGKSYRAGRRQKLTKQRPPVKKARIQLKPGQKIDLFDIENQ